MSQVADVLRSGLPFILDEADFIGFANTWLVFFVGDAAWPPESRQGADSHGCVRVRPPKLFASKNNNWLLPGAAVRPQEIVGCSLSSALGLAIAKIPPTKLVTQHGAAPRYLASSEVENLLNIPAEATNAIGKINKQSLEEREHRRKRILQNCVSGNMFHFALSATLG